MAVEAIRALRARDPLAAAFGAVAATCSGMDYGGQDLSGLRDRVLTALGSPARPAGSGGLTAPATGTFAERYAWITRHWLGAAARIGYVRTTDLLDVARAFGGDPVQASGLATCRAGRVPWRCRDRGRWTGPGRSSGGSSRVPRRSR
jgi:hypothetical protein